MKKRKNTLRTKLYRDISRAAMQFLSIILLCALGTFAFAALDGTARMMQGTLNQYFEENQLADFWITVPLADKLFGEGYFDAVIGQGPYEPKPDPSSTLAVLKEFGVEQSEAAFIGDSHIDMRTAKNSGLAAIGVAWGYRSESVLWDEGADAVAHDAEELFEILTSEGV